MPRISHQNSAKHNWYRLLFRFVSGRDMDGIERTDSTFLLAGTQSVRAHITRPSKWSMMPGYQRAGIRFLTTGLLLLSAYWWVTNHHTRVIALDAFIVFSLATYITYRIVIAVRHWTMRRNWILPLHRA